MRWVKTTMNSMWGLMGLQPVASRTEVRDRTEDIRHDMLDALAEKGSALNPVLVRRLQFAPDVESLWYLRSDWMSTLAATQGEGAALAHVQKLSRRFVGLVPDGMQFRPSNFS